MSLTFVAPWLRDTSPSDDDDLEHYYCCCSPDTALCGADLTDLEECDVEDSEETCVVCLDLKARVCVRCGLSVSAECWCGRCP